MTPLEILWGARNLLTPDGAWIQHELQIVEGGQMPPCYCLMGALLSAADQVVGNYDSVHGTIQGCPPLKAAHFYLKGQLLKTFNSLCSLVEWNDNPKRTQKQVLTLLDAAIAVTPPS